MRKKVIVILLAALVVGLAVYFAVSRGTISSSEVKPKGFSADGIKITLTNRFNETGEEGFTVCFSSDEVHVNVLREEFDPEADHTLDEFGEAAIENIDTDAEIELKSDGGLTYFSYEYTSTETNHQYLYYTFLYKASDAFWIVQFVTPEEYLQDYEESFFEWAKSVEFTG